MKNKWFPPLAQLLAVAVIYFATAKLGLSLAFLNASVSPVWPPTGVAIAAVWWLGYRVAPGVFLGAFLVNLLTLSLPVAAGSVAIAAGIASGCSAYVIFPPASGLRRSISSTTSRT